MYELASGAGLPVVTHGGGSAEGLYPSDVDWCAPERFAWWSGQLSPSNIGLQATLELLVIAVIGGLSRIEGAWVGAFAFIVINNEVTNRIPSDGLPVIGGSFNTVIGFVFLAIVIMSPDGLMGLWDRLWDLARFRGPERPAREASASAAR